MVWSILAISVQVDMSFEPSKVEYRIFMTTLSQARVGNIRILLTAIATPAPVSTPSQH